MGNFFKKLTANIFRSFYKGDKKEYSYKYGKEFYRWRVNLEHLIKDALLISFGVVLAGFGLKGFVLPNAFFDGGVTGISLIVNQLTNISVSFLIVVINLPFIFLGFKQMGKEFAIKSILAIFLLAMAIYFIDYPIITNDKLLISFFGGFFRSIGIGFSIRGGAVLDGTEIIAIYISKKTSLTIGDVILIFNIVIFSFVAAFFSIETAMYSVLIYFSASKTVDYIIEGIDEYSGATIVSNHSNEIRVMLIEKMHCGVTIYSGKRGYGKRGDTLNDIEIIYTVITRLEIGRLKSEIAKIDPHAFMTLSSIKDTKGGVIKKKSLKHNSH